ncbi:hypothetical protein G7046_g2337 [Stylonectria norvegica]|nr:hypothetical protein G7046_g2337 [Stylonectria norvegica]
MSHNPHGGDLNGRQPELGNERRQEQGGREGTENAQVLVPATGNQDNLRIDFLHIPESLTGDGAMEKLLGAVGWLRRWDPSTTVSGYEEGSKFGSAFFGDVESLSVAVELFVKTEVEVPVKRQPGTSGSPQGDWPDDNAYEGIEKVGLRVTVPDESTLKRLASWEEGLDDDDAADLEDRLQGAREALQKATKPLTQAREHRFVTLKVFTKEDTNQTAISTYQHMKKHANPAHDGFPHIRTALNTLTISHPEGDHFCLVQKPMWDSFRDLLYRNATHRFTEELLKGGLLQVLLALDYLHTECKLVHTDIKADNILLELDDPAVLEAFVQDELEHPAPRKIVDGRYIYASRTFRRTTKFGRAVLGDFGSAVSGEQKTSADVQPNIYRSPEVMLKMDWSYPVDIWNVGAMVWDLFEGRHMFYGEDPDGKGYSTRAHLAEVIGMIGPPPLDLIKRGARSHEFFTDEGKWKAEVEIKALSLEPTEQVLQGESKRLFQEFMRGMLQWRPEDRKTAKQLLNDPWLNSR